MTAAIEVRFTIRRTIRIEDRDAIDLYWDNPTQFEDLISDLADRQTVGEDDDLVSWSFQPVYDIPPVCPATSDDPGPA